ncbi:MAG: hypothetical protein AB8B55_08875 [Mariniblastus sp.]
MYDQGSPPLFEKYGGGGWPSVLLPNGFNSVDRFGGFGYGIVVVDEEGIVRSVNDFQFEKYVDQLFLTGTRDAKNEAEAKEIGGYWHNNKCWRHFEKKAMSADEVDQLVSDQLRRLEKSKVSLKTGRWNVSSVSVADWRTNYELTVFFNVGEKIKLKCSSPRGDNKKMSGTVRAYLLSGAGDSDSKVSYAEKGRATIKFGKNGEISVRGKLRPRDGKGDSHPFSIDFHESVVRLGTSNLKVKGDEAFLSGELGVRTYHQIKELIANQPNVRTLTLTKVQGSGNDSINMQTGRIIREAGLTTKVLSDSEVNSGGVDLFCSGVKRVVESGAKLGVHTWADQSLEGCDYPVDHPVHQYQLAYFESMLGEEPGSKFYFYKLNSAPNSKYHVMKPEELKRWGLATE